jgi:hypothetical protein
MNQKKLLSLSDALKTGRLSDFVTQEERRGVQPVSGTELLMAINTLATTLPPAEDQTSHSSSDDGSTGK